MDSSERPARSRDWKVSMITPRKSNTGAATAQPDEQALKSGASRQCAEFSQDPSHSESGGGSSERRSTTRCQIRDLGSGLLRCPAEAAISDTKSTSPLQGARCPHVGFV